MPATGTTIFTTSGAAQFPDLRTATQAATQIASPSNCTGSDPEVTSSHATIPAGTRIAVTIRSMSTRPRMAALRNAAGE